jgi:hypothetical protein
MANIHDQMMRCRIKIGLGRDGSLSVLILYIAMYLHIVHPWTRGNQDRLKMIHDLTEHL